MSNDDLILGTKINKPDKQNIQNFFSADRKFKVHTTGLDNYSVENAQLVEAILPLEEREKLLNGETQITYNGIIIEVVQENSVIACNDTQSHNSKAKHKDNAIADQVRNDEKNFDQNQEYSCAFQALEGEKTTFEAQENKVQRKRKARAKCQ